MKREETQKKKNHTKKSFNLHLFFFHSVAPPIAMGEDEYDEDSD